MKVVGMSQENSYSADKTQFKRSPLHTENNEYFWGLQRPSAQPVLSQEPQEQLASPGEGGWG